MIKFYTILLIILVFGIHSTAQIQQDSTFVEAIAIQSMGLDLMQGTDRLDSLNFDVAQKLDSLNPDLPRINNNLDSMKGRINYRIDSLNRLKLPTERYTRLLDSLNQLNPVHSMDQAERRVDDLQTKVDGLEAKVNEPANKIEEAVNDKLNLMKREGGEGANLPGNLNLPGVDAPDTEGIPSLDLGLNENKKEISGTPGIGLPNLGGVPAFDEFNKAQQGLGEVSKVTGEVAAYSEDVKNISSGNLDEVKQLPETLEAEAVKAVDAGEIQGQAQVVDQYKDVLANGNDPEALKKQALQQTPKLATNHFKGKEVALQQAIDKVNSYKDKYTELTDLENIPKRQPNEMNGKPLIERLVPAITLQIQNSTDFWLDYNLAIGYRVTKRFTTGLGWNERIGITSKIGFTTKDRVYGPRTYLDYKLKRGFALRTDIEKMNAFIPPYAFGPSDFGSRQWKWGIFMGMKKEYDFIKSVKGNFQFLYNVYNDHGHSPYQSRLVVRMGFEFPMKKKVKKENE